MFDSTRRIGRSQHKMPTGSLVGDSFTRRTCTKVKGGLVSDSESSCPCTNERVDGEDEEEDVAS